MSIVIVFFVQSIFMFFIDHKYRFLSDGGINKIIMFQGIIATMYVFIIPMVAKGEILSSIAYIIGSIVGTYASHKLHKRDIMRTEDQEFEELEKKIGAKTTDCRNQVTADMRWWFMETFGFAADDRSVLMRWNERYQDNG